VAAVVAVGRHFSLSIQEAEDAEAHHSKAPPGIASTSKVEAEATEAVAEAMAADLVEDVVVRAK
jgi:hypothetical protein